MRAGQLFVLVLFKGHQCEVAGRDHLAHDALFHLALLVLAVHALQLSADLTGLAFEQFRQLVLQDHRARGHQVQSLQQFVRARKHGFDWQQTAVLSGQTCGNVLPDPLQSREHLVQGLRQLQVQLLGQLLTKALREPKPAYRVRLLGLSELEVEHGGLHVQRHDTVVVARKGHGHVLAETRGRVLEPVGDGLDGLEVRLFGVTLPVVLPAVGPAAVLQIGKEQLHLEEEVRELEIGRHCQLGPEEHDVVHLGLLLAVSDQKALANKTVLVILRGPEHFVTVCAARHFCVAQDLPLRLEAPVGLQGLFVAVVGSEFDVVDTLEEEVDVPEGVNVDEDLDECFKRHFEQILDNK